VAFRVERASGRDHLLGAEVDAKIASFAQLDIDRDLSHV
jgi:hypothetical protein